MITKIATNKKTALIIPILILIIGTSYYFFFHNNTSAIEELPLPTEAPAPTIPEKVTSLIETVGQATQLPAQEIPNVATVTDLEKLQDQRFFAKAHQGDKVLIYTIAKRAFLYRPSTNEIIEQGPVEIVGSQQETNTDLLGASTSADTASDSAEPILRIQF